MSNANHDLHDHPSDSDRKEPVNESMPAADPEAATKSSADQKGGYPGWQLFSPSDQWIVGMICLILCGWVLVRNVTLSRWGQEEIRIRHQQPDLIVYQVDINRANWLEFSLLEGIGEVLGKKIVAYREEQSGFQSIDELMQVKGIGEKKFAAIKGQLLITPYQQEAQ